MKTFDKDFKKNFKIEGVLPPTIFKSIHGETYACSGSLWIEIPSDMTLDEVYKGYTKETIKKIEPKDIQTEVLSSKGDKKYKVQFKNGQWNCNCSGFGFRKKCAHIEKVKKELKNKVGIFNTN